MALVLVAIAAVVGVYLFTRTGELFLVSVRSGRVLLVRGRCPGSLLGEFRDIVSPTPRQPLTDTSRRPGASRPVLATYSV